MHGAGQGIGKHGNHALATQSHDGQGLIVLTGVDGQVIPAKGRCAGRGGDVAVCLFHRHNVGVLGELLIGGGLDVAASAAGYIVKDAGHLHTVRHVVEALDKSLLGSLVIIGGHQQQAVGAQVLGFLGKLYAESSVVAASTCDDRHPALHLFNDEFDHLGVFFCGHGGCFTGGTAGHNGVNATLDLEFYQALQLIPCNGSVLLKGCHQSGGSAGKDHLLHKDPPSKTQSK